MSDMADINYWIGESKRDHVRKAAHTVASPFGGQCQAADQAAISMKMQVSKQTLLSSIILRFSSYKTYLDPNGSLIDLTCSFSDARIRATSSA